MTAARDGRLRLADILGACDKIIERLPGSRGEFQLDEMAQVWTIHHIEVIGEAARHVRDEVKRAYPEVPWGALAGVRDRLIHGYADVDLDVIWEAAERDIPVLREQIVRILDAIEAEGT